jgi:hypothetical protein
LSKSEEEFLNYTELENPVMTEEGFSITVDTTQVTSYEFAIFSKDDHSSFAFSELFQIKVIEEP